MEGWNPNKNNIIEANFIVFVFDTLECCIFTASLTKLNFAKLEHISFLFLSQISSPL